MSGRYTFTGRVSSGMLGDVLWIRRLSSPATPMLVGVAMLLLVAALSATADSAVEVGQGWVPGAHRPPQSQQADAPGRNDPLETPPVVRAMAAIGLMLLLLTIGLVSLLGLVFMVMGIRIGWRRKQRLEAIVAVKAAEDGQQLDVELIRRAAGGALVSLREWSGGDPGDAVVLAWLTLEDAAADCGLARRPHQTPTEFTTAVLAGLDVDAAALHRLRLLYQRARFSTHPVTEDDVDAARDALRRLVADLEAAPDAPAVQGSAG